MKFFRAVKNIIFKVFGKARWFLIALAVVLLYYAFVYGFAGLWPTFNGVRYSGSSKFIRDIEPCAADSFSINDKGTAVLTDYQIADGIAAVFDFETWDKYHSNLNMITIDAMDDDYFYPANVIITDDNEIYSVRSFYSDVDNSILVSEEIVKAAADYEYIGTVCTIPYDVSSRQRLSKISRLHYFDGAVTFAVVEEDGVTLYSLDIATQALSESEFYPTDDNGTYTATVIPVDGSFLFLRSDGNVYNVAFDEPLGDSIYHFDIDPEGESGNPCFDIATLVDGKLYVTATWDLDAVYQIENGVAERVFDLGEDYSYVVALDAYHFEGDASESLIVCLDNEILTYSDGELYDYTPTVRFDPTVLMYIDASMGTVLLLIVIGLVINLIIRKKTLLYKQLIIILPVLIILTLIIAVKFFNYSDQQNAERINKDLTVICDLGKTEFEGFDFSGLTSATEYTGSTYKELQEKFDRLGSGHGHEWSEDYVFSVVYRTKDDDIVVIAGDDKVYMPLYERDGANFRDLASISDGVYIDNSVMSFIDDNDALSNIAIFGRIDDKDNTGNYYFMVRSDNSTLYDQRTEILLRVILYSLAVIGALILILVFSGLNTIRIIKKATKAVKEISHGNLSARINYKSKDELGQICSDVNEMGRSLESLFEEKDKTEKFYYKFVPEKFRELLGKENFTDLALGDAASCELTVLFTDIRGFSVNSEMMTAKENFAFANIIYGKMGPIVRKNNGFVDKYIGDAVMGLFENADDAVRCGIELYKSIVLDPRTAEELNVSDINIGIGVHTGMAMVGIVGESERLSGTVISETVNMSSRLESLTKQYHTAMLVSKSTIDRMKDPDSLNLRYLGIVQVAGVNEVEALYEVLDCLSDDVMAQRSANTKELREAIRLFSLGRRSEAVTYLQNIADSGRNDYVSDMYLNYIRGMSDDDKGNVFRFVRK